MKYLLILILASLFSYNAYAEFDLFDFDRGKPEPIKKQLPTTNNQSINQQKQIANPFQLRPQNPDYIQKNMLPQKDFTLKGTSKIGNKRAAILKGPDNQEFIQYFKNNRKTRFKPEQYSDYYLISVNSRQVEIEYPSNSTCRKSDAAKGIKCNSQNKGKTAILSLVWDKALAPRPINILTNNLQNKDKIKKRQEKYKKFRKKIIEDHEIPEGMRRVRTPFGDRLVPIKQKPNPLR